ncbi:MAG TPA: ABC transporter substrate-binding protein, partial [Thermoanaerobaculia bacterium]|nr:ABC transporter substrate-binding protein [Thermoanaerobaculia bacterium]
FRSPHPPYLDKVVIRVVPEVSSLVAEFLADNLDVVFGITPSDVKRIEAQPSLGVVSWLSRSFAFVAWNTRRELFHSPAARRALTLAIDRESLVEAIYGRYGKLSNSLIISDVWAYDRSLKPWPYDPAKAREILAAEGFRDIDGDGILDRGGKPFRFELATNSGNPQRQDALILIQQQLRKVGVDAQLRFVAFNPLMEQADRGEFDALLARWTMPTDLDLSFALATESIGRAQNIFGYSSPQMDRLLEKTRNAATLEEFHQGLLEVQQLVHQDLPLTLLYEAHDLGAYHRRVHGLQPNALRRFWQIEDWWRSP